MGNEMQTKSINSRGFVILLVLGSLPAMAIWVLGFLGIQEILKQIGAYSEPIGFLYIPVVFGYMLAAAIITAILLSIAGWRWRKGSSRRTVIILALLPDIITAAVLLLFSAIYLFERIDTAIIRKNAATASTYAECQRLRENNRTIATRSDCITRILKQTGDVQGCAEVRNDLSYCVDDFARFEGTYSACLGQGLTDQEVKKCYAVVDWKYRYTTSSTSLNVCLLAQQTLEDDIRCFNTVQSVPSTAAIQQLCKDFPQLMEEREGSRYCSYCNLLSADRQPRCKQRPEVYTRLDPPVFAESLNAVGDKNIVGFVMHLPADWSIDADSQDKLPIGVSGYGNRSFFASNEELANCLNERDAFDGCSPSTPSGIFVTVVDLYRPKMLLWQVVDELNTSGESFTVAYRDKTNPFAVFESRKQLCTNCLLNFRYLQQVGNYNIRRLSLGIFISEADRQDKTKQKSLMNDSRWLFEQVRADLLPSNFGL